MRKKLFWRIYLPYLILIITTIASFFFPHDLGLPFLLLFAALASLLLFLHTRRIAQAIDHTCSVAHSLAVGKLDVRVYQSGIEELDQLALALNTMAQRLDERLSALLKHQKEREAILSGISEGLIAVDAEQKIIEINKTACELFKIDINSARGKFVPALIRYSDLQKLIAEVIASKKSCVEEFAFEEPLSGKKIVLRIFGNIIGNQSNHIIGAVFILNDVTRIRQLEDIRRDFVANVSHELKTPVTSIKGFVETILNGSVKNEGDLKKFLGIVEKHANRLSTIIDDLLTLARLEENEIVSAMPIARETHLLSEILNNVVDLCDPKAKTKNITIKTECSEELSLFANKSLLEQALINILDNAIKYSEQKTEVVISASKSKDQVEVRIADQGPGIPAKYQERIFERFYRIDKARGRQEGGTGLGLAIVKHIAAVHGGKVNIKSEPGRGSIFSLVIPNGDQLGNIGDLKTVSG